MLITYQLQWEFADDLECRPFWTEGVSEADTRQNVAWECSFPYRLSAEQLAEWANSEWNLPEEDGFEIFPSFAGIPLHPSSDAAQRTGTTLYLDEPPNSGGRKRPPQEDLYEIYNKL